MNILFELAAIALFFGVLWSIAKANDNKAKKRYAVLTRALEARHAIKDDEIAKEAAIKLRDAAFANAAKKANSRLLPLFPECSSCDYGSDSAAFQKPL